MTSFYLPASGQVFLAPELFQNTGFSPDSDPAVLAANGIYTVITETCPFDLALYQPTATYTVIGDYAQQGWVATPYPLPVAKDSGSAEAKQTANAAVNTLACGCGFSNDLLTGVASQDYFDRAARYQAELDEIAAVATQLDADLTAIDNAPNVDTIDSILRHPSGTIMTGRGGLGPDDMQPSYFTVLENLPPGIGEPELEIYIPGTDTVIPYDDALPAPYKFDSMGDCYNTGDYRTVIRVAATGQVLSTVYPAEGAQAPIEWTYNPNIPSYGGGSSSHHSA